jgi:hypothetical protein
VARDETEFFTGRSKVRFDDDEPQRPRDMEGLDERLERMSSNKAEESVADRGGRDGDIGSDHLDKHVVVPPLQSYDALITPAVKVEDCSIVMEHLRMR